MDEQKNREVENGNFFNLFKFKKIENECKVDLLKTESIDSDISDQEPIIPVCGIENAHLANFAASNLSGSKRRRTLHSTFLLLKKKLDLEQFMRKTQIDSLLKKCKSKAFKTIHEALKKCLNIKLPRLPQNFITNIKIDFNKVYLEKTILEIYREHKIIPSVDEFVAKKYLIDDKIGVFKDFLALTFRNVFEYYVNSKQYVKDYYHIQQREGEKFAILFNYISKVFIQYYTKSKGNRPKKVKEEAEAFDGYSPFHDNNGIKLEPPAEDDIKIEDPILTPLLGNVTFPAAPQPKKKKENPVPHQIKRKPVFKRIKVKRVCLKKKIVKVCENTSPIFEIKKLTKKLFDDSDIPVKIEKHPLEHLADFNNTPEMTPHNQEIIKI